MKKYILLYIALYGLNASAQVEIALLKNAQAEFMQTRKSMVLTEPIVQRGTFVYIAPDSICWKYDGLENVNLPEQMLSLIKQAVSGNMDSTKGIFDMVWHGKCLTLIPKKKQISKFFKQISIHFNTTGVATKVCLEEPKGDQTEIEFINMKYSTL